MNGINFNKNSIFKDNIRKYENVSRMIEDPEILEGMLLVTSGYHNKLDGGSASYIASNLKSDTFCIDLDNGLFANMILDTIMNPIQFGAVGDGVTDDTYAVQLAINNCEIVDGLNKTYIMNPTELVPGDTSTSYKAVNITSSSRIQNGQFKLTSDVVRGVCVFGINTADTVTFENVIIDGNVASQTIVTGDGANHGIVIPKFGEGGTVRLLNSTIQNCRTDGIMHRCGFLEVFQSKIFNGYRNGITCDRNAHISYSIFDSSQSKTNPNTSIYHEPNEGYNFKDIRIHIENCAFNSGNTGISIFGADSTSYISNLIIENCYCIEEDGTWNCTVTSVDQPIKNVCIRNNDNVRIKLSARSIDDYPTSYLGPVVLDGNTLKEILFGDATNIGAITDLTLKNMDFTSYQLLFRTKLRNNCYIENCVFGFPEEESIPAGANGACLYFPSHPIRLSNLYIKNCTFKHARYGIYRYGTATANASQLFVDNVTFKNIFALCCNLQFKEVYVTNCICKHDTDFSPSSSENYGFALNQTYNKVILANNCIFYQNKSKSWYNAPNLHETNCLYEYDPET